MMNEKPGSPSRRIRVLLIEDDAADRTIVRGLLRESGGDFEVIEATSAEQGLEQYRQQRPDCVLLDYYLPEMTGIDFLSELRGSREQVGAVPVALLSGSSNPEIATAVLEAGAQDFVIKGSLNGPGLARVIRNVIEKHRLQRSLEDKQTALELRKLELELLRDELEDRLIDVAEAAKAKEQFISVMSHEMRTPLNAILGYVDLMAMGIGGELPSGQQDHLDRIRLGGRHLLDLINDVLDLARADTQGLDLELRPIDATAALEEVTALLERQATANDVDLKLELATDLPLVTADVQRLRQILTNIIGNAVKFTEHGTITVRAWRNESGGLSIAISDTGIGISEENQRYIFQQFFQADGQRTRRYGGSGLGLAISQRLAQHMGGEITVESELGKGSTFTVTLPAADAATTRSRETADAPGSMPEPYQIEPVSVLAFGERSDVLERLAKSVRSNVKLQWTTQLDDLAAMVVECNPSLVILEAGASRGSAWEAANRLHQSEAAANIPVLLLPSFSATAADDATGGLDLGWVALVPKPFTAEQLTNAVTRAAFGRSSSDDSDYDVLVVDDDADSRRVAAQFLASGGAKVREASGGEEGLVAMRRQAPDVLVLDLMMPVLDGFGVLAAMRLDPLLASIPVVVLSAKSLTEEERRFLARATVRVLQKGEHRLSDVAALVLRAAGAAGS